MIRALLIASLVCAATAAAGPGGKPAGKPAGKPDPKAEAIDAVRSHVEGLADLENNPGLADDAIVLLPDGEVGDLKQVGCVEGVSNQFYGCLQASIKHALGKVEAVVDPAHHVAWYVAPYRVTITGEDPDTGKETHSHWDMRVGGIVIDGDVQVAMHSHLVSDKELLAGGAGGTPATGAPKLTGDAKLAQAAADWLKTGFASHAGKDPAQLIASGTAPAEFKTGAGALALARSWDHLKLAAKTIDARTFAGGAIGWVRAEVTMPLHTGKGAVEMVMGAVALPSPDGWRWVELEFLSSDAAHGY